MSRLSLPILALALLPACRTVYTDSASTASLEHAVTRAQGYAVWLDAEGQRPAEVRHLGLTDSTLTYQIAGTSERLSVPRADVQRIRRLRHFNRHALGGFVLTLGGGVAGAAVGCAADPEEYLCGEGAALGLLVGMGAGFALNAFANPRRVELLYQAP